MASNDNLDPDFADLEPITEELDAGAIDGMPDPTAQVDEPISAEESAEPAAKEKDKAKASESKSSGLMAKMAQASPFTVLLAISLLAVLIAVFCLMMQLASYGFDYKAKSAKRQAASAAGFLVEPHQTERV